MQNLFVTVLLCRKLYSQPFFFFFLFSPFKAVFLKEFWVKVSIKNSLTTHLPCSIFRNSCMWKRSPQAELQVTTLMLNQVALLMAAQPTDLLAEGKEVSSGRGKAIWPNVWGLFAWQRDSEGKGSRHCLGRVTANRPQTSLDKRHLSNHTIPLDTFVPLELLQSAAALQPRLISLGTEAINPQDKCRLNTQTENSHNLPVSI